MRITELHLLSPDLAGTEAFYSRQLQLPVLHRSPAAVCFGVGHSTLWFHAAPAPSQPFYHVAFSIPFAQVDAAHAWMAARLPVLPYSPTEAIANFTTWQARAFYFHDDNGSILECIGRAMLPDAGQEEFTPASLLGINEVGLPMPNVPHDCEALTATYQVPFFARGPRMADFAALGDDNGLFIVSAIGRGWVPTHRPAERHPLTVAFEQNGAAHKLELLSTEG